MKERSEILEKLGITITKEEIENQARIKKEMLEKGNPYEINEWVKDTYGISANEMIDAIIKTGDILQIYEFLYLIVDAKKEITFYKSLNDLGISNEKLNSLQEVILKSGNAKLIRYCIGFVPGIDLNKYLKSLYDTKSLWDIRELSEGEDYTDEKEVANPELIERVELDEYKQAIKEAEKYAQSGEYFPESLGDYKEQKDDITLLMKKVIETKSPYLMCELANYVQYSPQIENEKKLTVLEELAKAELATCDAMGIYEFLSSVDCISLKLFEKMVNKIIEIGDEKYMRYTLEFTPYAEKMEGSHIIENELKRLKMEREAKEIIKKKRERGER